MAIHLPVTDTLILEVPKTGSKWVRTAVDAAGVPNAQVGPEGWRGHGNLTIHTEPHKMVACFVREPMAWYRSYFAYRKARGWRPRYELDRLCQSDTLTGFIRSACTQLPGFLGGLYTLYAGPYQGRRCDFVGRTERLADDLVRLLRSAGEHFDETALRATAPVNTSSSRPVVSVENEELIYLSEYDAASRFGYLTDRQDPLGLREFDVRYSSHLVTLRRLALWTEQRHWQFDDQRELARRAVRDRTRHARNLTNFGLYAQFVLNDVGLARRLFERAVTEDPDHPRSACMLAVHLQQAGEYDEAERLFRHGLELRPAHPELLGGYALFLKNVRQDVDQAEVLYRRALDAHPAHARNLGNYAVLLHTVRHELDAAASLYRRSLEVDPNNVTFREDYESLLAEMRYR